MENENTEKKEGRKNGNKRRKEEKYEDVAVGNPHDFKGKDLFLNTA